MDENVDPGNIIATCTNLQEQGVTTPPIAHWVPPAYANLAVGAGQLWSGGVAALLAVGRAMVDRAGEEILDMHTPLGSDSEP
jgi:hypothetical protein